MKKKPGFRLNGAVLDMQEVPIVVRRMAEIVSKLLDDELLDTTELAKRLHRSRERLLNNSTHQALAPYRTVIAYPSRMLVFGNARTIKRLQKAMEGA